LELLDLGGKPVETAQRLELLLALGEAQRRAGDGTYRQTLLDAAGLAARLGDAEHLAEAALANNRGAWTYTMGVDTEKIAVLESALTAFPAGDNPVRARLLANIGQELVFAGKGNRHLVLTEAALAMANRIDDPATRAHVLRARCVAIFSEPSFVPEWLTNSAELVGVAESLADPYLQADGGHIRFNAAFQAGLVDEADKALELAEQLVEEVGQPILRWWLAVDRAGRVLAAGRIHEAEALIARTLEIGLATGQPDARQYHASLRFQLLYESGRLAEDVTRLTEAVDRSDRPVLRAMLALALSETERCDDARAVIEPLVTVLPDIPLPVGLWFWTLVPTAFTCARLGEASLALPVHDILLRSADLITGNMLGWNGSGHQPLGMLATVLGRFATAEQHFSAAEASHVRMGAPSWLARTHLEWARMLLTRRAPGDAADARAHLPQALDLARRLGLAKVESEAVALLTDCPA
ncbi:MAG: hypothetical protein LC792_17790, partial [Actinobacteria bacterium]|nr:hypothetical protein [Actinomycetota bacterium]